MCTITPDGFINGTLRASPRTTFAIAGCPLNTSGTLRGGTLRDDSILT